MKTSAQELSGITEPLIILALDANLEHSSKEKRTIHDKTRGVFLDIEDQGQLLKLPSMKPVSAYTFDAVDDRIYTPDPCLLMKKPWEILGERAEVMTLFFDALKWFGFERMKSTPKNISVSGKVEVCYALHVRLITPRGVEQYYQRIIPFGKNGKPLPAKIQGNWVCSPKQEGENAILCASLIEDAQRPNAMLATVSDATEIKFPVPMGDYKALFSDRAGPLLKSGKRKAILHWVSEHLRQSVTGTEHQVTEHARGIDKFIFDGLRVGIALNA